MHSFFGDFFVGFRICFRARFLFIAVLSLLTLLGAVFVSAEFSGRQPATVGLDVGLSVIRLLLPLMLVLMAQELLAREFDRRYVLSTLAYPRSRNSFLIGRFFTVATLILGLLLVMALLLVLVVKFIGQDYAQSTPVALGSHYLVVISFIGVDLLLLTALACLLAVVASTPSLVLIGTFGFMLVARSFAAIVELLTRNALVVGDGESYRAGVGLLGYFLPDLGALDVRMVTLYGTMDFLPANWPWLLLACLGYIVALLALAVWALQRKRFA